MSYTEANTSHIKDAILALPFVESIEYVGRVALCGSSDHDVDLLVEFSIPTDWQTMTDQDINDRLIDHMNAIIETIGKKEDTTPCFTYIPTGELEWVGYSSRVPDFNVLVTMNFITPDGIPIDIFWVVAISASAAINHDYFVDIVQWRIDGGCP